MTRKHFMLLAEIISELKNSEERKRMADVIGNVCADSNKHFDWTRWRSACGA